MASSKIAISLPAEVYDALERNRKVSGMSRSEYIARALLEHMRQEEERAAVNRYVEGYLRHPETEEDAVASDALRWEVLDNEPWDAPR